MWAHRVGVPRLCASRIRVIVSSFLQGTLGYVVYEYMAKLQINNLSIYGRLSTQAADTAADAAPDVGATSEASAVCLDQWPKRTEQSGAWRMWAPQAWRTWASYQFKPEEYLERHQCQENLWASCLLMEEQKQCDYTSGCYWTGQRCISEVQHYRESQCSAMRIPMQTVDWDLGYPLGDIVPHHGFNDMLYVYANVFLMFCMANVAAFMVHDLALLHVSAKNYVLDWRDLNEGFPFFRKFPRWTFLPQLQRRMCPMRKVDRPSTCYLGCLMFVFPFLLVWAVFLFVFFLVPMVVGLFMLYPVRLSRFWAFVLLVLMALIGCLLAVNQLVFLSFPITRPRYALTWSVADGACNCGCSYSMSTDIHQRLVLIGVGVAVQSLLRALRCLKGLRRSQWANLMSVLFPIPIAVYSVEWNQLFSEEPARGRKPGQPVQSEMAFDPFALMDEQPESRYTSISLRPEAIVDRTVPGKWKPLGIGRDVEGPNIGMDSKKQVGGWQVEAAEYIGCCGFPCLTGGYQAVLPPSSDSEDEEEVEVNTRNSVHSGQSQKPKLFGKFGWRKLKRRVTFGLLKDSDLALARQITRATSSARDLQKTNSRIRKELSTASSMPYDMSRAVTAPERGSLRRPSDDSLREDSPVYSSEGVGSHGLGSQTFGSQNLGSPVASHAVGDTPGSSLDLQSARPRRRRGTGISRTVSFKEDSNLSQVFTGATGSRGSNPDRSRRKSIVIPAMGIQRAPTLSKVVKKNIMYEAMEGSPSGTVVKNPSADKSPKSISRREVKVLSPPAIIEMQDINSARSHRSGSRSSFLSAESGEEEDFRKALIDGGDRRKTSSELREQEEQEYGQLSWSPRRQHSPVMSAATVPEDSAFFGDSAVLPTVSWRATSTKKSALRTSGSSRSQSSGLKSQFADQSAVDLEHGGA